MSISQDPDPKKPTPDESDRCPIEEVALVVPETDDPTLPVLTFRAWFLGLTSCSILIFLNTFFTYRTQPLTISAILMQIAVLPIGRFMASVLPNREVRVFGGWGFNLNPGPFDIKEHVIITIFANCGVSPGGGDAYSIGAITVMKGYYKQSVGFLCALIIVLTTQLIGYGWAGMLRKFLVDPAEMWWPSNLAQVSLFRALHEKDVNSKGPSRMKFFMIFFVGSFVYYAFPGYIFPILSFFSWVCWAWPRSITAQQIGSGYHGLGIGATAPCPAVPAQLPRPRRAASAVLAAAGLRPGPVQQPIQILRAANVAGLRRCPVRPPEATRCAFRPATVACRHGQRCDGGDHRRPEFYGGAGGRDHVDHGRRQLKQRQQGWHG